MLQEVFQLCWAAQDRSFVLYSKLTGVQGIRVPAGDKMTPKIINVASGGHERDLGRGETQAV